MKKGFLSEVKRLHSKNYPFQKYEGKFFNDEHWRLFIRMGCLPEYPDDDDIFECLLHGSFSECLKYLEEHNILRLEVEKNLLPNTSVAQYYKSQKDYRQKIIKNCFEIGEFETDNWSIHNYKLYDIVGSDSEFVKVNYQP